VITSVGRCIYRQDAAKQQTAGIEFTHKPKISIFAPHGRLIAQIHVKFGMTKGRVGLLGHTNFMPIGARGEISTFW